MKPKPFSPLNHLTVPCAMTHLLASRGRTVRLSDCCRTPVLTHAHAKSQGRSTNHGSRIATAHSVCHTPRSQEFVGYMAVPSQYLSYATRTGLAFVTAGRRAH